MVRSRKPLSLAPALAAGLVACVGLSGCLGGGGVDPYANYRSQPLYGQGAVAGAPGGFPNIGYATWRDDEPDYRLYPGDVVDVSLLSAPELNRTVTVQPDGRITLPLIPPVMAADRSAPQLQQLLSQAYASQLVRPDVSLSVKQSTPLKVFVGGMVDKPGVYDMPGDIDALQAVIMAGGFRQGAKSAQVVILRRGQDGGAMLRTANLKGGGGGRGRNGFVADPVPLRRFDVIYVPRTGLSELGSFVSQLKDALPFQFSYVINGQYVTTR